jgi:hypothetical protein
MPVRITAVYVDFRKRRTTNLGNGVPRLEIATSCPKTVQQVSLYVAARPGLETT